MNTDLAYITERATKVGDDAYEARELLSDTRPAPPPVIPTGRVFEAYPDDDAAYIDDGGDLVVRRRWFYEEQARDFAHWILATFGDKAAA